MAIGDDVTRKSLGLRKTGNVSYIGTMTAYEKPALSMLKSFDVNCIKPELILVTKHTDRSILWDYWRFALSTEPQNRSVTNGRMTRFMVRDQTSGAFLGVMAITDQIQNDKFVDSFLGWDVEDRDTQGNGRAIKNVNKFAKIQTIAVFRRNLAVHEFGPFTAGKLFTLLCFSKEIVRQLERQYSFKLSIMILRSVHGKGSVYNRMHQYGLQYLGIEEPRGWGVYLMELRDGALDWLRGNREEMGEICRPTYAESFKIWKERWLENRIAHIGTNLVVPDPSKYILSDKAVGR